MGPGLRLEPGEPLQDNTRPEQGVTGEAKAEGPRLPTGVSASLSPLSSSRSTSSFAYSFLPPDLLSLERRCSRLRYFDTQADAGGGYVDASGWGGLFSASTTLHTKSPWFARIVVNHIYVPKNLDTNTYVLGVGYHLWEERPEEQGKPGEAPEADERKRKIAGDEVTLSFGQTVVNSLKDQKGFAGGIEIRKGIAEHIDWTLSWLNAGDVQVDRRNGLGMQLWLVDEYFDSHFPVGIGAGPIYLLDRRNNPDGNQGNVRDLAGLVTLTAAYRFSEHWFARFHWIRVFTSNNTDADLFLAGIGYRFRE